MAFIWIDKKDGEDFILASDINGIAKELINIGKDSAKKDLSNVDNEVFKAKAEEAGVGDDNAELLGDAPMVFKGVVSELPETADEQEVYKVYGLMNEYIGEAFETYDNTFKIYPDRIEFGTETDIFTEVFNAVSKENGAKVNFEIDFYDTGEMHTIAATKAENNILYGTTDVGSGYVVGNGAISFRKVGLVNKTMIYHNGEWVEL